MQRTPLTTMPRRQGLFILRCTNLLIIIIIVIIIGSIFNLLSRLVAAQHKQIRPKFD